MEEIQKKINELVAKRLEKVLALDRLKNEMSRARADVKELEKELHMIDQLLEENLNIIRK